MFSIIEKWEEGAVTEKIRRVQQRFDEWIPRYIPENAMAELEKSSRGSEEILKGLAVAIGDHMQQAIAKLGHEVRDALREAAIEGQGPLVQQSAELLANAITTELGRLKDQIGAMAEEFSKQFNGASNELMTSVKDFEPTVKGLSEIVASDQHSIGEAVEKLNSHESVMAEMAAAANQIHQAALSFASMNQTLENAAASNESSSKAQLSAAASNKVVAEKFDSIASNLPLVQETIVEAAKVIASIIGPILELKSYLEKLPEKQEEDQRYRTQLADERDRRMLDMTSELIEKVKAVSEQFAKVGPLAERLAEAAKSLDDASNELATFGRHVLDASDAQKIASEESRKAAAYGEQAAKFLSPIPEKIGELTKGLDAAGTSMRVGAETVRNSYRELIMAQKNWMEGVEIGLKGMRDRLQEILKAYGDQIEPKTSVIMLIIIYLNQY